MAVSRFGGITNIQKLLEISTKIDSPELNNITETISLLTESILKTKLYIASKTSELMLKSDYTLAQNLISYSAEIDLIVNELRQLEPIETTSNENAPAEEIESLGEFDFDSAVTKKDSNTALTVEERIAQISTKHRVLKIKKPNFGVYARGYVDNSGKCVVFEGSTARVDHTKTFSENYNRQLEIKKKLIYSGALVKIDGALQFTKDIQFNSLSQAAGIIIGNAANGHVEWV